jgi:hypothetical protein
MKRILLLLSIILMSCTDDNNQEPAIENTIIGRWHLVGFEETVMYEFTETHRYTIYSSNGNFGDITTAIPNPNPWEYDGENLVIDLFFGNSSISIPNFRCNGNVVDLGFGTLFREGYNITNCSE